MALISYIENGEPVDDVVSNRALRQVISASGLDPDDDFPGFLTVLPISNQGSLIGTANSFNFVGAAVTATLVGSVATVTINVEVGPGTTGNLAAFNSTETIGDTGWSVDSGDILPDADATQSLGSAALKIGNIHTDLFTLYTALCIGIDPAATGQIRYTDTFAITGKDLDGTDRTVFSADTNKNTFQTTLIEIGDKATGASQIHLVKGAGLYVVSPNGNISAGAIKSAGNFSTNMSIGPWEFSFDTGTIFKAFELGFPLGYIGNDGLPLAAVYAQGLWAGNNLANGAATVGFIRGIREYKWYNRDFADSGDLLVIGTNADDEVVIGNYFRMPLSGPSAPDDVLQWDGTDFLWGPAGSGGSSIIGSGTIGTIPVFVTSTTEIGNSVITQSSTAITIAGTLGVGSSLPSSGTIRLPNAGTIQYTAGGGAGLPAFTFGTGATITIQVFENANQGTFSIRGGSIVEFLNNGGTTFLGAIWGNTSGADSIMLTGQLRIRFNIGTNATGTTQVEIDDGTLYPTTNNDIDIGTSSLKFKNYYGVGGATWGLTSISTTTTLTANHYTVLCDATAGAMDVDLPAAASHAGRIYIIKKIDASANAVSVDPNGAELIDGSGTSYDLSTQWQSVTIQSNGTSWFILAAFP